MIAEDGLIAFSAMQRQIAETMTAGAGRLPDLQAPASVSMRGLLATLADDLARYPHSIPRAIYGFPGPAETPSLEQMLVDCRARLASSRERGRTPGTSGAGIRPFCMFEHEDLAAAEIALERLVEPGAA